MRDRSLEDEFLPIADVCDRFRFSRSTFYRMLRDRESGLADLVIRVPPHTGRVRVPVRAFEELLRREGDA